MDNQEDLILNLESHIEIVKFKYENLFKNSDESLEKFLEKNYSEFRAEFAKLSTDTLHKGILNNLTSQVFINQVLSVNIENVYKLLNELKKIEESKN